MVATKVAATKNIDTNTRGSTIKLDQQIGLKLLKELATHSMTTIPIIMLPYLTFTKSDNSHLESRKKRLSF